MPPSTRRRYTSSGEIIPIRTASQLPPLKQRYHKGVRIGSRSRKLREARRRAYEEAREQALVEARKRAYEETRKRAYEMARERGCEEQLKAGEQVLDVMAKGRADDPPFFYFLVFRGAGNPKLQIITATECGCVLNGALDRPTKIDLRILRGVRESAFTHNHNKLFANANSTQAPDPYRLGILEDGEVDEKFVDYINDNHKNGILPPFRLFVAMTRLLKGLPLEQIPIDLAVTNEYAKQLFKKWNTLGDAPEDRCCGICREAEFTHPDGEANTTQCNHGQDEPEEELERGSASSGDDVFKERPAILPICGHVVGAECMAQWLEHSLLQCQKENLVYDELGRWIPTCPFCRAKVNETADGKTMADYLVAKAHAENLSADGSN